MTPTRSFALVPSRGPAWLFLAAALLFPATATAAGEPQKPETERTYVTGGATIHWKLDASRLSAASRERAARMAKTFGDLVAGRLEAKDLQDEEIEVEVLADGTRQARVPAYLMNTAFLRYGTEASPVCSDRPQIPPADLRVSAPSTPSEVQ